MTFKVDFHADEAGETLTGYDVTISEDATGKSYTISKQGDYLASFSQYLKQGMAIQVSNFAVDPDQVEYLTHDACTEECPARSQFKFGALTIESTDKVYPPSEPA